MRTLLNPAAADGGGGMATAERSRYSNIKAAADALAKQFPEARAKFDKMADDAFRNGDGVAAFNIALLAAIPGIRQAQVSRIGMSEQEIGKYSLLRAFRSCIENKGILQKDCPEFDQHQQAVKAMGENSNQVQGFMIPADVIVGRSRQTVLQRDLNVTTAAQGGGFVSTTVMTPIIEILRNKMVTQRLGIQTLSGLQGNIAIPRQTQAATAYTLAEAATLTKSTQAINQVSLSPHRVGAWNAYTKQLLLQSSVDVENFVRDDLMKQLAIKIDYMVLEGPGGSSPLGVKATTGIGAVTFGAAATYAKMVEFETDLALANADLGRMAYVTSPDVRGKLKTAPKITSSTFPIFIWEDGNWADGSNDGKVNSYRAAATNQITESKVAFGNWEDDILAMWGGYDVVIDPYTSAASGVVNVVVNAFVDNCVRHAGSFAWSTDSGAQ